MDSPHLVFVSAEGGSAFMEELLEAVADAVTQTGARASTHRGHVGDVLADSATVAVVVPHEYFASSPPDDAECRARTIGFGVEHPGTRTFESAARATAALGASFEISDAGVAALRRRDVRVHRFQLGISRLWCQPEPEDGRDIDVAHLATADETRMRTLAAIIGDLEGLRVELLLPPHEPMTKPRPDFLMGRDKWQLLARSRVLLNLHRESAFSFEWVRALEAIANGAVVLTEPSEGLAPLVPGEHLLVAERSRLGRVAAAALADPDRLAAIAAAARQLCDEELDMVGSAARLVEVAAGLLGRPVPHASGRVRATPRVAPGLAMWVPVLAPRPEHPDDDQGSGRRPPPPVDLADSRRLRRDADVSPRVDVICSAFVDDGPIALTVESASRCSTAAELHIWTENPSDAPHHASTVVTRLGGPAAIGRGGARNALLARGDAPFVLVLDAGDEVLTGALDDLVGLLIHDPTADIAVPMAVLNDEMIVNAMPPESRRLDRFVYLGRGFLARRSALETLGGFEEHGSRQDLVDHDFWQRVVRADMKVIHRRTVGVRLWRSPADDEVDGATHAAAG